LLLRWAPSENVSLLCRGFLLQGCSIHQSEGKTPVTVERDPELRPIDNPDDWLEPTNERLMTRRKGTVESVRFDPATAATVRRAAKVLGQIQSEFVRAASVERVTHVLQRQIVHARSGYAVRTIRLSQTSFMPGSAQYSEPERGPISGASKVSIERHPSAAD
jgi:hypothetical protein